MSLPSSLLLSFRLIVEFLQVFICSLLLLRLFAMETQVSVLAVSWLGKQVIEIAMRIVRQKLTKFASVDRFS